VSFYRLVLGFSRHVKSMHGYPAAQPANHSSPQAKAKQFSCQSRTAPA
jgi:hypothetical protein